MEDDVKIILNEILNEMGKLNKKIDAIQSESCTNHTQTLGILASVNNDIESMSVDIRYLVRREADNRHRMMLLDKRFNRSI